MDLVLDRHCSFLRLVVTSTPKLCIQVPVNVGAKTSYHLLILSFFSYAPLIRIIVTSEGLKLKQDLDFKAFLLLSENLTVPYLQARYH